MMNFALEFKSLTPTPVQLRAGSVSKVPRIKASDFGVGFSPVKEPLQLDHDLRCIFNTKLIILNERNPSLFEFHLKCKIHLLRISHLLADRAGSSRCSQCSAPGWRRRS